MHWLDVDGVRDHLGGRENVSRKVVYGMVAKGLRVARLEEPREDSRGRRRQGRIWTCDEWIDAFLISRSGERKDPTS